MMMAQGEWTDEEFSQIETYIRSESESHRLLARFVEDDDWEVLSVERRNESRSIVDVKLTRIADGKRLNFEFSADSGSEEWGDGGHLTDQVFWLTIILMEYVGIFGIDDLDDDSTVRLVPRRSVYDFRPPGNPEVVHDSEDSHQYWDGLDGTTPIPLDE
jgi:hypothetical protein